MSQTVKTIITVIVSICCSFVCLFAGILFLINMDQISSDLTYMSSPVILEGDIRYLGDTFQGMSEEDCLYYEVSLTFDNRSNYGREENSVAVWFESGMTESHYRVFEEIPPNYQYGMEKSYLPAGKKGSFTYVVGVEQGCGQVLVHAENYTTGDQQRLLLPVPGI